MNDAGIARRRFLAWTRVPFQRERFAPGLCKRTGGRESDDAAADDYYVSRIHVCELSSTRRVLNPVAGRFRAANRKFTAEHTEIAEMNQ
jgi:hypothetical protein